MYTFGALENPVDRLRWLLSRVFVTESTQWETFIIRRDGHLTYTVFFCGLKFSVRPSGNPLQQTAIELVVETVLTLLYKKVRGEELTRHTRKKKCATVASRALAGFEAA